MAKLQGQGAPRKAPRPAGPAWRAVFLCVHKGSEKTLRGSHLCAEKQGREAGVLHQGSQGFQGLLLRCVPGDFLQHSGQGGQGRVLPLAG